MAIKKLDILGSPLYKDAKKIMLLGCGELGREVIIEAQRLGIETIGVDRYENAPGQQVAHRAYTINMKDGGALRAIVERENPDAIVPEIEAINLDTLLELEKDGYNVIPNAKATYITMNRERSRELIAKKAGVVTSKYVYASTASMEDFKDGVEKIGYPCISKAIMSSSGHGSYFIKDKNDLEAALKEAVEGARGSGEKVIIEEYIPFDTEVTELAVRHLDENGKVVTSFPKPVGHYQIEGDYHSSWQGPNVEDYLPLGPEKDNNGELALEAEKKIYEAAEKITDALGGLGLFGCELFVKQDGNKVKVYGNECSPRPHDTGMVTFLSHPGSLSEGGLHARAITGMPIPSEKEGKFRKIKAVLPAASHVLLSPSEGWNPSFKNVYKTLNDPDVIARFFCKPEAHLGRRMGVIIATGKNVPDAKKKAEECAHRIEIGAGGVYGKQIEKKKHLL